MSLNFPNSATQGQVFTSTTGLQYVYLDGVWRIVEAPQDIGKAEARNRIVNGAMQISQQNGSTIGTTDQYYLADQWAGSFTLTGAPNMNRSGPVLPNMSDYFLSVVIVTPTPSPTAGQFLHLFQRIEGVRVRDFMHGTANAKQAVLRFTCFATITGTFTVAVKNGDSTRTYLAPFTITAANTWETKTLVIPGDTTGTWAADTDAGMVIAFGYAAGTTYQGTAGWQAGNKIQIAGATNLAAATTNQMLITQVGLYLDPLNTGIAPPWQMPDEAEELLACKRYWQTALASHRSYGAIASTFAQHPINFGTATRIANPAVTVTAGSRSNVLSVSIGTISSVGCGYIVQQGGTIGDFYCLSDTLTINARM